MHGILRIRQLPRHFVFSQLEEGRRFAKFLVAQLMRRGTMLPLSSSLLRNLRYYHEGDEAKLPIEKKSYNLNSGSQSHSPSESPMVLRSERIHGSNDAKSMGTGPAELCQCLARGRRAHHRRRKFKRAERVEQLYFSARRTAGLHSERR